MPAINVVFETGVHVATLRDVAWSTFSNGDLLAHMPSEHVFALNDAYQAQAQVERIQETFYPVALQLPTQLTTSTDLRGAILTLQMHLADVVAAEEHAVARIDAALAALGVEPSEEPTP